jgi:hypothetical protein
MAPLNFSVSSILRNQTKIDHQLIQQHTPFQHPATTWEEGGGVETKKNLANIGFYFFADGFGDSRRVPDIPHCGSRIWPGEGWPKISTLILALKPLFLIGDGKLLKQFFFFRFL